MHTPTAIVCIRRPRMADHDLEAEIFDPVRG